MKICFLDELEPDGTPPVPWPGGLAQTQPLVHLARILADQGHQISLLSSRPAENPDCRCLDQASLPMDFWTQEAFDAVIGVRGFARLLQVPGSVRRICWDPVLTDQPASQPADLARALSSGALDALVCRSYWQFLSLWKASPLPRQHVHLLPELAPPGFFTDSLDSTRLGAAHNHAWLLASLWPTADELALLRDIMPTLRQAYPQLRLHILAPDTTQALASDPAQGIGWQLSKSPADLALALQQSHLVLLPDPASDALRLQLALAAGGRVICADRQEQREIAASLARLLPTADSFRQDLIQAIHQELANWSQNPAGVQQRLTDQARHVATASRWEVYAQQWETLLKQPAATPVQVAARPLRWGFLDVNILDYQVASPEQIPLGGSQAALCYLTRQLAARGHQVTLASNTSQPGNYHGVRCLNHKALAPEFWQDFDMVVSLNEFEPLGRLPVKAVFWNQHNPRVDNISKLAEVREQLAAVVYVSAWQQQAFREAFGIPPDPLRSFIIPNACPPYYLPLPSQPLDFLARRPGPLTLAYTSTPNRGLGILVALFPGLRQLFPGLRLKVFSSLRVYQSPAHEEAEFLPLYEACRQLDGVEYCGSVTQTGLAAALRSVHVLAYPNVYEETSCIAAMEAMAAGCQIVTSELGALPETTAGFARLVPYQPQTQAFGLAYFDALRESLEHWLRNPQKLAEQLLDQSRYALAHYQWELQALRWEELARRLTSAAR